MSRALAGRVLVGLACLVGAAGAVHLIAMVAVARDGSPGMTVADAYRELPGAIVDMLAGRGANP